METMTTEEAYKITRDLCISYDIPLSSVKTRNKNRTWGTAYTKTGMIVYSAKLFGQGRWKVLETICHEVAHLLAVKRYNRNCGHDRQFQMCEAEVDALYNIKPIYARARGYAAAYMDLTSGMVLECKAGYKMENGKVIIDRQRKSKDRMVRKIMRAAFNARVFNAGDVFHFMTCEAFEGRLALTVNGGRGIIYQSELKSADFRADIEDVKYTGRSLRYIIKYNK